MAQSISETDLSQPNQQHTENDNENFIHDNIDEHQSETVTEILAHDAEDLGNWADVLAEDLPTLENGTTEEQPLATIEQPPLPVVPEVYPHKLAIIRGSDLTVCQVPDKPPFNLLVFELPDTVTEEELYMLFGGKRAVSIQKKNINKYINLLQIECHMYRRDLREIIFSFRKQGHLIEALLKENMIFKEKPLRLALILWGFQISKFHEHNQLHSGYDLKMIPFKGAFEKCHERLEDGTLSELFDEEMTPPVEMESVPSTPQPVSNKKYSNDVRMSQPQYFHQNSVPSNRQRTESITSITSAKSSTDHGGSISRQSSYHPSEKQAQSNYPRDNPRGIQTHQSIERQQPSPSPASSAASQKRHVIQRIRPSNPFGEAKPVNTDKKVLTIQEGLMAQKSVEHQKNVPPAMTQPPPPINTPRFPEMGTIKIQKRPEVMLPPPQNGQMQFINSTFAQGPHMQQFRHPIPPSHSHHHQQQQHHPLFNPNHVNLGDETIDVSKPPPVFNKKHEEKKHQRRDNRKHSNYQNIPNGFNPNNMQHNYASHQSLPPAPPTRRKSSTDQRAGSETIQTEKSQSAPVSHETVAMSQISPRSSPSYNSLKRPNSANSSMSFVTAHSGSEMSSAMSTDLPCILDSIDSITERLR
jgi:hypothetical protein